MTQEEKTLLLQDLCARLPYGVKVHTEVYDTVVLEPYYLDQHEILHPIAYLRPISSMTEEELSEYRANCRYHNIKGTIIYEDTYKSFDWLNANHFDYRGLIEKGLAIEVPEGMYNV